MLNIIIFTHGDLASGLVSAVNVIAGSIPNSTVLSLKLEDNPDDLKEKILNIIDNSNESDKFLIINDIFGGTPSNLSLMCVGLRPARIIRVIAGANLGMLLELVNDVSNVQNIDEIVSKCLEAGTNGVVNSIKKVRS